MKIVGVSLKPSREGEAKSSIDPQDALLTLVGQWIRAKVYSAAPGTEPDKSLTRHRRPS